MLILTMPIGGALVACNQSELGFTLRELRDAIDRGEYRVDEVGDDECGLLDGLTYNPDGFDSTDRSRDAAFGPLNDRRTEVDPPDQAEFLASLTGLRSMLG